MERLEDQLRANLKRRKDAARARSQPAGASPDASQVDGSQADKPAAPEPEHD